MNTSTRQRIKRGLARLILGLIFLGVFLGVSEGLARWCFGDKIVLFPRFHDAAVYGPYTLRRLRPDTTFSHESVDGRWRFRTNKQGFRDDHDYAYAKPPGRIRVLCLGDSHTQGFECSQQHTFAQVLERYALARGLEVEALNAGISGTGTAEQLVFLEQEGLRYHPDYVVLGFYASDFNDNLKADLFRVKDGALVTSKFASAPSCFPARCRASRPYSPTSSGSIRRISRRWMGSWIT